MKRFLFISAILGLLFFALGVDVVPVRCECCRGVTFHTDVAAMCFGAHRNVIHYRCAGIHSQPFFVEDPESPVVTIDSEWAQSDKGLAVDQPS